MPPLRQFLNGKKLSFLRLLALELAENVEHVQLDPGQQPGEFRKSLVEIFEANPELLGYLEAMKDVEVVPGDPTEIFVGDNGPSSIVITKSKGKGSRQGQPAGSSQEKESSAPLADAEGHSTDEEPPQRKVKSDNGHSTDEEQAQAKGQNPISKVRTSVKIPRLSVVGSAKGRSRGSSRASSPGVDLQRQGSAIMRMLNTAHSRNWIFQGKGDVEEFLRRVEKLAVLYGLDMEEIWPAISDLMAAPADRWFDQHVAEWANWTEVKKAFLSAYAPRRREALTLQELLGRTQEPDERPIDYISAVRKLSKKLGMTVDEKLVIDIVLGNLQPLYQSHLAFMTFPNLTALEDACSAIEAAIGRGVSFTPEKNSVSALNLDQDGSDFEVAALKCYNCDKFHEGGFRNCSQPRTLFCSKCGRKNISTALCNHPRLQKQMVERTPQSPQPAPVAPPQQSDQVAEIWKAIAALTEQVKQLASLPKN